jgi:hypothetical protein
MEAKFKKYSVHAWSEDMKWHRYLDNIYPMPGPARLEKMKKKFYRMTHDKDFDVDWEPSQQNA